MKMIFKMIKSFIIFGHLTGLLFGTTMWNYYISHFNEKSNEYYESVKNIQEMNF